MNPSSRVIPSVTKQKVQRKLHVFVGSIIRDVIFFTSINRLPCARCIQVDFVFSNEPDQDIHQESQ